MRTIPHELNKRLNSTAEEKVFGEFKQLKLAEPSYLVHSLNLTKTERKKAGEIDFLVVADDCVLVLEVKGGRVRHTEHGTWEFMDRYDQTTEKRESPFKQASEAMYALINRLKAQGFPEVEGFAYGYGVVFPDIDFTVESVEWDLQTVLDARAFQTPRSFEQAIKRLLRYWKTKANRPRAVEPETYKALLSRLRPSFELVPTLASQAQALDQEFSSLTAGQYHYMDATSLNKRVLCSGGAGTGKTFMLLETARRGAAAGERVLITCESVPLAAHMRQQLGVSDPLISVLPFSALGDQTGPFDMVLVDEGQDILDMEGLDVLDRVVKGGLERGKWRVFYDPNHQAAIRGRFEPGAEAYLQELATIVHLAQNCRNTRDIADQTLLLTGARIGEPIVSRGMKVELLFHADEEEQLWNLVNVLKKLESNNIPRSDVTILSMRDAEHATSARLPFERTRGLRGVADSVSPVKRDTGYTAGSIEDFKGLESRFLILTDIEGDFTEKRVNDLLYVGMTRARVGLYVLLPKQQRAHIMRLALEHDLERMSS